MAESADPIVNQLNLMFWQGAAEGVLMMPHCVATGAAFWPPSPISPFRGGESVEWRAVSPSGTVLARVVYRRAFQQAFAPCLPYGIAMIGLDCGVRLQVHVPRPDEPDAPVVGDRVTIFFDVLLPGGKRLPVARVTAA